VSGKATNRGGDGLELVPHLRGVPLPSPRQSALLTITFNQPFTQWALEGCTSTVDIEVLQTMDGRQKFCHELDILPGGVLRSQRGKEER